MKKLILLSLSLFTILPLSACNKPILYGRNKEMEPITRTFSASPQEAFKAAKETLVDLGYKIDKEDKSEESLQTTWQSTKAASHYIDLFDRRDYGTIGAYYKVHVHVDEKDSKAEVQVSTETKSVIVGRLRSAYSEEKKVLNKMADLLRHDDFEMTNVGVSE